MRPNFSGVLVSLVFVLIGAVVIAIPLLMQREMDRFLETALRTTGTVIDLEVVDSSDSDSADTYRPVVAFYTEGEQYVTFRESNSEYPARFAVNENVEVYYNPLNPTEAHVGIYTAIQTNTLWLVFLGMGAVFVIIGLLGVVGSLLRR